MSEEPKLAVVLGTYNRLELLRRCLKSIRLTSPPGTVVHVTDAGSTDGTVEFLRAQSNDQLVGHLIGKKIGQARALNDVFRQLTTEYVAWLSDDNIVLDGGLTEACRILDGEPDLGMIGLKVKDVQGPFIAAQYIGGISTAGILNVNQGLLRRSILNEVGGFSEEFMDYGIDPDLTAKVLFTGCGIAYTKAVVIHHYRSWAETSDPRGQQILREKHDRYYSLYNQKYASVLPKDSWWERKQAFWAANQVRIATSRLLTGPRSLYRSNERDWMNAFKGRFIRLGDARANAHKAFHLVQRLSHSSRAATSGK
jgi:GT2 family glycosyltransferase